MRTTAKSVLEKEARVVALAHEAPIVIGKGDIDGVDLARLHELFQLGPTQHAPELAHGPSLCSPVERLNHPPAPFQGKPGPEITGESHGLQENARGRADDGRAPHAQAA